MRRTKKWLAIIMAAAVVASGVGTTQLGTVSAYAQSVAQAAIETEQTDATVTIKGSNGSSFEYDTTKEDFANIIASAKAGDTVIVKGTVVLNDDVTIDNGLSGTGIITLDLSSASIRTAAGTAYAIKPGTNISEYQKSTGVWVYSKKEFSADNIVIDFPPTYTTTSDNTYGVKVSYTMASGETIASTDADAPATVLNVTPTGTAPTCKEAGTAKLKAVVTKDGTEIATATKDYGDIDALGHKYAESSSIKDGVILLSKYEDGAQASSGDAVQLTWAIRGTGGNLNVSKDADGNTLIENVKTKCLNGDAHGIGVNAPGYEKAKSAVIKKAEVGAAASTGKAGSTIYTIEVVTADGDTITVKQTVYDVPALDATNVGLITKLGFETLAYTKDGKKYVQKAGAATYEQTIYADYTQVGDIYYKTVIASDGAINYEITYKDAENEAKTGTVTGTMKAVNIDNSHKTAINSCGCNTYFYKPVEVVALKNDKVSTNIVKIGAASVDSSVAAAADLSADRDSQAGKFATNNFKVDVPVTAVKHTVDMNNGTMTVVKAASTYAKGSATIICKYCGKTATAEIPMLTSGIIYEKADGTTTDADDIQSAQNEGTFEKKATCADKGYKFYWSANTDDENAGFSASPKTDSSGSAKKYTDDAGNIHHYAGTEIKIDGTETPATGHDWYISKPADAVWTGTSLCTITYTCKNSKYDTKTVKYYATNGTDQELVKYNAISKTTVAAADCTKNNTIVYTVDGVTDILGNKVQTTENATTVGAHDFVDEINWSEDGKKATVSRVCKNEKCKGDGSSTDGGYHKSALIVSASVTGKNQEDGSTLYTASYDGQEVGTKTVFDLSGKNVKVVVNNGEAVDNNVYTGLTKLPEFTVSINGVEISSDLYKVENYVENTLADGTTPDGTAQFDIVAQDDTNAYGKVTAKYNILLNHTFTVPTFKFDDANPVSTAGTISAVYDGTAHKIVIDSVLDDSGNDVVKKTTVKYAVVSELTIVKDPETLAYEDSAEITDVGGYAVYYQLSQKGYTTKTGKLTNVRITKIPTDKALSVNNRVMTYGDATLSVTSGDSDFDKLIDLQMKDVSKLGVGYYKIKDLVTYNENYSIDFEDPTNGIQIEKRKATIVMNDITKTYDGKAIDPQTLYTVDGVVNGDTLNVVINTEGNKEILNPGTYTLIATANDPNYDIERKTATVTILADSNDQAAAQAVIDQLAALTSSSSAADAKKAIAAYNALTAAQKAIVDANGTAKANLTKAQETAKGGSSTTKTTLKKAKITTVKLAKKTFKASALKKKKATTKIKVTKKTGNGKITYKKLKGSSKKITVSKAGKITVKKGTKKGTYKVKVKVTMAKTSKYKKATKTVTLKIKVK